MKQVLILAIRLYPRSWRERYGGEMAALIQDGNVGLPDLINLIGAAFVAHRAAWAPRATRLSTGGLDAVLEHSAQRPHRYATAATLVMLPTATFVGAAVLKYVAGVPAPFDALEPSITPFVTTPIGEALVTLAPYVALLIALVPAVRLDLHWTDGRIAGRIDLALPIVNAIVAVASCALIATMAIYWLAENL
jgi:hypothetical protein